MLNLLYSLILTLSIQILDEKNYMRDIYKRWCDKVVKICTKKVIPKAKNGCFRMTFYYLRLNMKQS